LAAFSFLLEASDFSCLAADFFLSSLVVSFLYSFLPHFFLLDYFLLEASDFVCHASVRRCLSADCFHASSASASASHNAAAP